MTEHENDLESRSTGRRKTVGKPCGEPAISALITVFRSKGDGNEPVATVAIDAHTFGHAPSGESIRVDVNSLDDTPLCLGAFLHFLRAIKPIFPGARHLTAVFKDALGGRIVFLPEPDETDGADWRERHVGENTKIVVTPARETKLCDIDGVRVSEPDFPAQLVRLESGKLAIRGINEGGFACVDIDLGDLLEWLSKMAPGSLDVRGVVSVLSAWEHDK